MKTTRILAALLLGCSLAAAQVQAPESGAGTIKTQIKNLDNDSFEVRTKAMDALRAAGEAARADLEAARKSESLEVRTRAETLLKDLDSKKAQAPVQKRAVKPLVPDDEKKPADKKPGETGAAQPPRFEDFKDPNAYMQAMQKWMQDWMNRQIGGEPRGWNIMRGPDEKDWNEFTIETPGGQLVTSGATSISVTHKDGETVTWKTGVP
jgi:hypothetical protein